jgi:hypothetical protein
MNLQELKESLDKVFNDQVADESISPSAIAVELKKIVDVIYGNLSALNSILSSDYKENVEDIVVQPGDSVEDALGKLAYGLSKIPDVSNFLKSEDLPDLSKYATIEELENINLVAANLSLSDLYEKSTDEWIVLPGDSIEKAIGKIAYGLDQVLLVDEGILKVFIKDNGVLVNAIIQITNSSGVVVFDEMSTKGTVSKVLPRGIYFVRLNALGYDVLSSSLVDNNNGNNQLVGNTYNNVDVGAFDSVINFNIKPSFAPTFNTFTINEGSLSTSNKDLRLNIGYSGIASEISISRVESGVGQTWVPYIPGNFPYVFEYASDIKLILYVKLRNSTGSSEMLTTSIDMLNGISRSDIATTYNSLDVCLRSIVIDYPNGLTRNVTISILNEVYNLSSHKFSTELKDFNKGTPFYLHIKGENQLTIDCKTGGGMRFDHCENIIFSGIDFINASSYHDMYAPELLSALYFNVCRNMLVSDCRFDGTYTKDPTKRAGRYGIVVIDNNNFTITNCHLSNFGLRAIDIQNVPVVSILKTTIENCVIIRDLISQPSIIELKNIEVLRIEDCILDGKGADTMISGLNVVRAYINRTELKNCPGEIISLFNSIKSELLSIKNCLIKDNLFKPYYPWTKQNIEIDSIEVVEFINNTVRFTALLGDNFYARFMRANMRIGLLKNYNNVFDFYMPKMINNRAESTLFQSPLIDVVESDFNIYRDYSADGNVMANRVFIITNTSSKFYTNKGGTISLLRGLGLEANSVLIPTTQELFVNDDLRKIDPAFYNFNYSSTYIPKLDIDKLLATVGNAGCSYVRGVVGTNVTEIEYLGLYVPNGDIFDELETNYVVNSGSKIVLSVDKYNDEGIFIWTLSSTDAPDKIFIGTNVLVLLKSNLNAEGKYTSDKYYSLKIEKI